MTFIKNIVMILSLLMMSNVAFADGEEAEGEAAVENNACITFTEAKHYEEVKAKHEEEKAKKEDEDAKHEGVEAEKEHAKAKEEHDKGHEAKAAEHEAKKHEHEAKKDEHEHKHKEHKAEKDDLDAKHAPADSTQCVDASGNAGFLPAAVSSVTGSGAYREIQGQ